MEPFVWQARLVKLEEGNILMSAIFEPNDWDFLRGDRAQAVALAMPSMIQDMVVDAQGHLVVSCADGDYLIDNGFTDSMTVTKINYRASAVDTARIAAAADGELMRCGVAQDPNRFEPVVLLDVAPVDTVRQALADNEVRPDVVA